MLRRISKYFSPELLAAIYKMGHGDEIILADAFFPGHSLNKHTLRMDGVTIENLLEGILPLFPLDTYVNDALVMMKASKGDKSDPSVEKSYKNIIDKYSSPTSNIIKISRYTFYERAKSAFAVVITGSDKKYANIILKKGVI